jgi:hypothetical protein
MRKRWSRFSLLLHAEVSYWLPLEVPLILRPITRKVKTRKCTNLDGRPCRERMRFAEQRDSFQSRLNCRLDFQMANSLVSPAHARRATSDACEIWPVDSASFLTAFTLLIKISSPRCEATSDERSAGNLHATFCGSRGLVTAPGPPVAPGNWCPYRDQLTKDVSCRILFGWKSLFSFLLLARHSFP